MWFPRELRSVNCTTDSVPHGGGVRGAGFCTPVSVTGCDGIASQARTVVFGPGQISREGASYEVLVAALPMIGCGCPAQ